jgi:hypothetical protein
MSQRFKTTVVSQGASVSAVASATAPGRRALV